jgi:hypothetical protein
VVDRSQNPPNPQVRGGHLIPVDAEAAERLGSDLAHAVERVGLWTDADAKVVRGRDEPHRVVAASLHDARHVRVPHRLYDAVGGQHVGVERGAEVALGPLLLSRQLDLHSRAAL